MQAIKQKRKKFVKLIPASKKEEVLSKGGDVLKKVNFINKNSQSSKYMNEAFNPAKPLRPVMLAGLRTKGIPVKNNAPISLLTERFYNEVVRNANKTRNTKFADAGMRATDIMSCPNVDSFDTAKNAILDGVVSFIKNVKSKKEGGGSLSKVEENVYNATKAVEANIEKQAKEEASKQLGAKILFDPKIRTVLIVVVVAIVGFLLFRK